MFSFRIGRLVPELSELALDDQFFLVALFDAADDLCVDVEALGHVRERGTLPGGDPY